MDKVYLDVELNRLGIRIYLNTIERPTGIPHWVSLRNISLKGQFISHLTLSHFNSQWNLTVTYKDRIKKFIKQKGAWVEVE